MANADSKSGPLNEESRTIIEYRECWRNHAMLTGGSAVDGCGEFTPKGDQGTKEALICEACGCHRNFHRKQLIKNGIIILDTHLSPPPCSGCHRNFHRKQLTKNGIIILDTHLSPPPCRLYGASMWVEKNASGFHPLSSLPLTSPSPPCYPRTSVSDQESLVYVPSPSPYLRKSEKKMKARKGPKRGTLMHERK